MKGKKQRMAGNTNLLKLLYPVFSPAPLTSVDQNLYVDLEAVRGNTGFVQSLKTPIELGGANTCQLLTGHLGSGKSTELHNLKVALQATAARPFVVVCDVSSDLNPADLDYPDLLVMILRSLAVELEQQGISLKPGKLQARLEWVKKHLLTEVDFENITFKVGMAELGGILQHSPDTRKKLRQLIDPETDSWIEAANDIIGVAKQKLQKKGFNDLVILVDGLDKLSRDFHEKAACSLGEHLYIHRYRELSSLLCHVVYTIPLYLAHSSAAHRITSLYGMTDIPVVPVTKVRERPPSTALSEAGVEQLREVIRRRLNSIGAMENDVFAPGAVDRLIKQTGGQLRDLLIFVRDAAATRLPVDDSAIDRVENAVRRAYARWLEQKHWPIIEEVQASGGFTKTDDNAKIAEQLLESRAILHYRNTEEWFGANPLLPDPPAKRSL